MNPPPRKTLCTLRKTVLLAAALLALPTVCGAEVSGAPEEAFRFSARGLGDIEVSLRQVGEKKDASLTTFAAQDGEHAEATGSKRLADLLGFGGIEPVADSGLPGTVLGLDGTGFWLLGLEGANFHELFAPSKEALAKSARDAGADAWQPVPERAYPRWLDFFDNAALTFWISGFGVRPENFAADFQWLADNDFTMCGANSSWEDRLVAPGLLDTSLMDWHAAAAKQYDIPFKTMANMTTPERSAGLWPYVAPPHPDRSFYPVAETDVPMMDFRRRAAARLKDDPNFIGHMGMQEIYIGHNPLALGGLAKAAATSDSMLELWRTYLRDERGFDLAEVGRRHAGDAKAFRSWDEVPFPRLLDLAAGGGELFLDLLGPWEGRAERGNQADKEAWHEGGGPSELWTPVDCRDARIEAYLPRHKRDVAQTYWLRRNFTLAPGQEKLAKYLHLSRPGGGHHGARFPHTGYEVWVNGQKAKIVSSTDPSSPDSSLCYDISGAVQPGENRVVLHINGFRIDPDVGYAFISDTGPWLYPSRSAQLNARFSDMVGFDEWLVLRELENRLVGIRAGEPYRPIKIMCASNYTDAILELCARYGAYPHDTGSSGAWFAPFNYSRNAMARGIASSVEPGSAPRTAAVIQAATTRYLMMGTEAVDWVASVEGYRKGEVGEWIAKNRELLRCHGKLEMPAPRLALLRSRRELRLGIDDIYRWDPGRGELAAAGRPFHYIGPRHFLSGLADNYPVVMDCGSTVLDKEEVAAILDYVRRGGTFIARHQTGRHTPLQADSWPLADALGLKVVPKWIKPGATWERPTYDSIHHSPLAKITFAEDQDLIPRLRGRTMEGSGVSIDWQGQEDRGSVGFTGGEAPEKADIRAVATWDEDGTMAIVEAKIGKGRIILLGSPFFTRMKDEDGRWVHQNEESRALFEEFMQAVGVDEEMRGNGLWGQPWRSKNGIFDVFMFAQMNPKAEPAKFEVAIRRDTPPSGIRDLSTLDRAAVTFDAAEGWLRLRDVPMEAMQTRVFAMPRADLTRGAMDWAQTQARQWAPVEEIAATDVAGFTVDVPGDIVPVIDDWQFTAGTGTSDEWKAPGFKADGVWKTGRLGSFAAMGLPEDGVARFRREVALPEAWRGQRVFLHFNSQDWFWGIGREGQFWINGEPAALAQPLRPQPDGRFTLELSPEQTAAGTLTLALEVDGRKRDPNEPDYRPGGVTGAFFLRAVPPPASQLELAQWQAASDLGREEAVAVGDKVDCLYLETSFTLPEQWPGPRLALRLPAHAASGRVWLNDRELSYPLADADLAKLVRRDGQNTLRLFGPLGQNYAGTVPEVQLEWRD